MRATIFCKREDDVSAEVANELKVAFAENGISCVNEDESPELLAVVGGDGTVLASAKLAIELSIPIFSVNAGTVGFLAGAERGEIFSAVKKILKSDYYVSERSVLNVACGRESFLAVNDAVIERDKSSNSQSVISKLRLSIDGVSVYDLRADGVIIATPTGSTAYSLSAGGVILTPELRSFIATPICSHALSTRPIVYSDSGIARVEVLRSSADCVLSVDGKAVKNLSAGDCITVEKSKKILKIIEFKRNFFRTIKEKLGE